MAKFLVISEYQDPPSRPSYMYICVPFTGLYALQKLLDGTRNVQSASSAVRRYDKFGNKDDAFEDFFSVHPSNVKKLAKSDFGSLRNGVS